MEEPVGRLFIAVPLPDEVRLAVADRLSQVTIPGKVVPPENWHITLRFLGRSEQIAYERLLAELDEADRGPGFDIELGRLGAFPRPRGATVTWMAVDGGEDLEELAALSEEAARAAGFPAEDRPFRPHLTLSRVRPPVDASDLIEGFEDPGLRWRCRSMVVYRSHVGRGGARYEPLETFPLDG